MHLYKIKILLTAFTFHSWALKIKLLFFSSRMMRIISYLYMLVLHFYFLLEIKQGQKPLVWGEPESSTKKSILTPWKKMTSMVRTSSNLSSTSSKRAYKPTSRRSTPNTPTKYERKTHNSHLAVLKFSVEN